MVFSAPALIASTTATRASSDKLESGSAGNLAQTAAKAIKDLEKSYRLQVGIRRHWWEVGTAAGSLGAFRDPGVTPRRQGTGVSGKIAGTP